MTNTALAYATLIFAAMAGIGSLVRVYQNERLYRWHKKRHRTNVPKE